MKILIVDDNQTITTMLSKFLKLKGHDVTATNSGKDGLSLCTGIKFDVVILDLAMPQFTGKDFLDSLIDDGKIYEQKIIVFTAMPIGQYQLSNLPGGITKVLKKPVGLDLLLKSIAE